MVTGFISKESDMYNELIEIFPDGIIPLKSPIAGKGKGRDNEKIEFYEVDIKKLSDDQINKILKRFKRMGLKFNQQEFFNEGYRILTKHFSAIGFDSRLIT